MLRKVVALGKGAQMAEEIDVRHNVFVMKGKEYVDYLDRQKEDLQTRDDLLRKFGFMAATAPNSSGIRGQCRTAAQPALRLRAAHGREVT